MIGDMSRLPALRLALAVAATLVCACGPTTQSDSETGTLACVEESVEISLEDEPAEYEDIHAAIVAVPGTYSASGTWLDHDTPTQITTTLGFSTDSYMRTVVDQGPVCLVRVSLPVHVVVETSDGYLMLDQMATWSGDRLMEVGILADDIETGTVLSAAPDDAAWLDFAVAQMWPDVATADDDAELELQLSHGADGLAGELNYSRRSVIDGMTVIYTDALLLGWGSP